MYNITAYCAPSSSISFCQKWIKFIGKQAFQIKWLIDFLFIEKNIYLNKGFWQNNSVRSTHRKCLEKLKDITRRALLKWFKDFVQKKKSVTTTISYSNHTLYTHKLLPLHLSTQINPLHPNISINILHTVLCTFSKVLKRRICSTIKSFFSWWSFLLFSWP